MKSRLTCIVFSVFLVLSGISPALGVSTGAHLADTTDVTLGAHLADTTDATPVDEPGTDPAVRAGGMPGWPVPDKPIPYHKPGYPSKAGSYSTQVTRMNAQGTEETVTLTGLTALQANGVMDDPLQGNYRLADMDKVLVRAGDTMTTYHAISGTASLPIEPIGGSGISFPGLQDVAAGDLNGDGQDEQIMAGLEPVSGTLALTIGGMPGSLGRATSAPANTPSAIVTPAAW